MSYCDTVYFMLWLEINCHVQQSHSNVDLSYDIRIHNVQGCKTVQLYYIRICLPTHELVPQLPSTIVYIYELLAERGR